MTALDKLQTIRTLIVSIVASPNRARNKRRHYRHEDGDLPYVEPQMTKSSINGLRRL